MNAADAIQGLSLSVNDTLQRGYPLSDLCFLVINNKRFAESAGGVTKHHQYAGGLAVHTFEVMTNVFELTGHQPSAELVTACVWHDYMKIREYSVEVIEAVEHEWINSVKGCSCGYKPNLNHMTHWETQWRHHKFTNPDSERVETVIKHDYRKLIGHVAGSFAEFMHAARNVQLDEAIIETVGHIMLSHHGRYEWRSPVEPITADARILHVADLMSADGIVL